MSSAGAAIFGSNTTRAECVMRLTLASDTPGVSFSACSTCDWHPAQVIPATGRVSVTVPSDLVEEPTLCLHVCRISGFGNGRYKSSRVDVIVRKVNSGRTNLNLIYLYAGNRIQSLRHAANAGSAVHILNS